MEPPPPPPPAAPPNSQSHPHTFHHCCSHAPSSHFHLPLFIRPCFRHHYHHFHHHHHHHFHFHQHQHHPFPFPTFHCPLSFKPTTSIPLPFCPVGPAGFSSPPLQNEISAPLGPEADGDREVLGGKEAFSSASGLEQQEWREDHEVEEEEDEEDIFVMTDEWKEFFAKSEAKRRLEKQQRKKGNK